MSVPCLLSSPTTAGSLYQSVKILFLVGFAECGGEYGRDRAMGAPERNWQVRASSCGDTTRARRDRVAPVPFDGWSRSLARGRASRPALPGIAGRARPRRAEGAALVRCLLPLQNRLQDKLVAFLPARRKVEVEAMGNKTLAVDASIWIYHVSKP